MTLDAKGDRIEVMACRRCDASVIEFGAIVLSPTTTSAATAAAAVRDRIAQALDDHAGGLASIDPDNDYSVWTRAASFVRRLTPGELGE